MPSSICKYFVVCNLLLALLLIFSFSPLSETVEVVSEKTAPVLKQLNNQNAALVAHLLDSIRAESGRARAAVWVAFAWLLVNAAVSFWLQRKIRGDEKSSDHGPAKATEP